MVKKYCLSILLLLATYFVQAQESKTSALYNWVMEKRQQQETVIINLFKKSNNASPAAIKNTLAHSQLLVLNENKSKELFKAKPFSISLPVAFDNNTYQLELVQENISDGLLKVGKLTGNGTPVAAGTLNVLHYRGYVNGSKNSLACVSIFANGQMMCLFANEEGNFNLGRINNGQYILYNSNDMVSAPGFICGTGEIPAGGNTTEAITETITPTPLAVPPLLCKKVRVYWEGDYSLYNENFSNNFNNTVNYLSGLFNQVATMYSNEGILLELSELYVWATQDPYTITNSSTGLSSIKNRWNALSNTFKGDLCMLIDGGQTNYGGQAYVLTNNLCNRANAYGYTNIDGFYNNVPSYSWDVEAVTHEMGHNLGSRHTHWCGWNTGAGNTCGAIDDCATIQTTAACATCGATTVTNPTAPTGFKGTVMSYCHLRSGIGINLANGFGPLPQEVIRNTVNNASCAIKNNVWTGAASTAWENIANWSCGNLPDATTDVTIPALLLNYPIIQSNATCRKLTQKGNTSVNLRPGFKLDIVGRN